MQRRLLRKNGYRVVTATNGYDGLRVFAMAAVDAIVLGYYLALLDGAVVAAAMKRVKPQVPIVMLSDGLELPEGAFETVDALVIKSDGPRFLLSTLQWVLGAETVPVGPGNGKGTLRSEFMSDRQGALDDLRSLIDAFPPRVRPHVVAEVRSVLGVLAPQCCAPELTRKALSPSGPGHDFRPRTLPPTGSAGR